MSGAALVFATPRRVATRRKPGIEAALPFLVPAAVLTIWGAACAFGVASKLILPPPESVAHALIDMAASGDLSQSLAISFTRVVGGFFAGAAAGLAAGTLLGLSRIAENLLRPMIFGFLQVPVLAWIPLLMIPFGIGETLKYAAIGVAVFGPVFLHTHKGLRQVPPMLVEVGVALRLTPWQRLRFILAPGAIPAIATGLRLGCTQAWQSLVVVELVAATEGIGYLSVMARQMFQLDRMFATMVVIGIVGFLLDRVLRVAERRVSRCFGALA